MVKLRKKTLNRNGVGAAKPLKNHQTRWCPLKNLTIASSQKFDHRSSLLNIFAKIGCLWIIVQWLNPNNQFHLMAMQAMTNWVIIPRFWYLRSDTRDSSSRLIRAPINQHHQLYDSKLCTGGRLWKHNALLDKWMVQVCKGWRILIYLDFMRAGNTGTMGGWYLLSSDIYDRQFSQVLILMKTDKYYKNDYISCWNYEISTRTTGGCYLLSFPISFACQFLLEPYIWICIRY